MSGWRTVGRLAVSAIPALEESWGLPAWFEVVSGLGSLLVLPLVLVLDGLPIALAPALALLASANGGRTSFYPKSPISIRPGSHDMEKWGRRIVTTWHGLPQCIHIESQRGRGGFARLKFMFTENQY